MESSSVKIYSAEDSPRLKYIAGIILGDILGLSWEIITDRRKLGKHPVINYSDRNIPGSFNICPAKLLFEKNIKDQEIIPGEWKGLPVFFPSTTDSDIPFDVFAASFFLVTRYEEYLEFNPDFHGRFQSSSSVASRLGFLDKPVIDLWTREMSKELLRKFNLLTFRRCEYQSLLTVDIDEPFEYHENSLLKSIGGFFGSRKQDKVHHENRSGSVPEPENNSEDIFVYITENIRKGKAGARFFIPVGDSSKYDKNPSWKNSEYRNLIHRIAGSFNTGLHPSYNAAINSSLLGKEKERLTTLLKDDVKSSRFHYCRLMFPQSYRNLIKAGISEDFSMGYPDEPGFRAGIARPFLFFDVINDTQSELRIIPFQVMDETLVKYKNFGPVQSEGVILKLIGETRKAGGLFVSIWHNTTLHDSPEGKGWRNVFESMLKNQIQ